MTFVPCIAVFISGISLVASDNSLWIFVSNFWRIKFISSSVKEFTPLKKSMNKSKNLKIMKSIVCFLVQRWIATDYDSASPCLLYSICQGGLELDRLVFHSMARANLNKSEKLVTNTTAASKYPSSSESASIEIPFSDCGPLTLTLMLRYYLSPTYHFYSDWLWPYCDKSIQFLNSSFGFLEKKNIY